MPATYLDDATVKEILRLRPVYITTQFVRNYDNPTCEILAVQFSFESAVLKAMQTALSSLSETAYNPQLRWTARKLTRWEMDEGAEAPQYQWRDGWTGWTSMSTYQIEEWQPDRSKINKHDFRFDSWFKNKIADELPSCSTVKEWLSDWKQTIESGAIPPELMARVIPEDNKDDFRNEIPGPQGAWVAKYGCAHGYLGHPKAVPPHPDFA